MKYILCFLVVLLGSKLFTIDLNLANSAVQNATNGLNLVCLSPAAASENPAINTKGFETSATYLFGIKELPYYNLHLNWHWKNYQFHLGHSYLGHDYYKENCSSLALARKIENFTFAFALRHLNYNVENYGNDETLIFDGAISWENDNIHTAFALKNFSNATISNEPTPKYYLWELAYHVGKASCIGLGLEKENDQDFSFKLAARQDIFQKLTLLSSYQFDPDRMGFGVIFQIFKIKISYSARTHQYLDLSHYISIGYEF